MREVEKQNDGTHEITTHASQRNWSPFATVRRLFGDMDPLFDVRSGWSPEMSVEASNGHMLLHVSLPGVQAEDIDIHIDRRILTITGVRHQSHDERNKFVRFVGTFTRQVKLPDDVDADTVRARFENGVLEIMMAAPHPVPGRRVKIEHGS